MSNEKTRIPDSEILALCEEYIGASPIKGSVPFKGNNWMTPRIWKQGRFTAGYYLEISTGYGFEKQQVIGLTFRNVHGEDEYESSRMVNSVEEAVKYLDEKYLYLNAMAVRKERAL
jgi:hypothetical protein